MQSAVLVPLLCKDNELHVLLTERTLEVGSHKGQVCFPGGTLHPGDQSLAGHRAQRGMGGDRTEA